MTLFANPYIFFLIKDKGVVVWDYLKNQQFEITYEYFERLQFWSPQNTKEALDTVDHELLQGGLLSEAPYPIIDWQWDDLSKIFHMGTQDIPFFNSPDSKLEWLSGYADQCDTSLEEQNKYFIEREGEKTSLPEADLSGLGSTSLLQTLKSRKTNRIFHEKPVSLETVSTILFTSFGKFHGDEWAAEEGGDFKPLGIRKSSPSGGGLQSAEAYVMAYKIDGLEPGIYHYSVQHHELTKVNEAPSYKELTSHFYNQFFLENIPFGVFFVSHLDKYWGKYPHSRAYRVALLDVGHLSQTFLLTATACKLNTWLSAAFKDSEISKLLKVDGVTHTPLHFVAAGYGENASLPKVD